MNTRRPAAVLCTALAGALLLTGLARAVPGLDQQQTTLDEDNWILVGSDDPQILGQTLTSGVAGLLTQVDLPVACEPESDLVLQIRNSVAMLPGSTVLASRTVSGIPDTEDWKSITLEPPPFITDEKAFAIVLSSPGSCGAQAGPFNVDLYPRGAGYYQGSPNPPGAWAPAGADLGFKTYVDAICQVPALVAEREPDGPALEKYGCALGTVTRAYSRAVPTGDVVSQSRPEGTRLPAGSKVDVVVSRGASPCKVPNVRRMRLARAKATLTRALCRVGSVRKVRSAKAMTGRVIRQRPAPGRRLPEGGRVSLVVGRR
jgi:PASTA domain-containing protein